jgi:uncharacterized protein (TIGR02996 family)
MSDPSALLAAILAHPDEDTPRLAYADWLSEHAEDEPDRARAEFIRLQIELARGISDARRRKAVETRCAELERDHHPRWLHAIWKFVGVGAVTAEFRRGFVGHATGPTDAPAWVSAVAAACPVQEISFRGHLTPPDTTAWADLAAQPELERVRGIHFEWLPTSVAEAFFPSPHFTGLRTLCANWAPAEAVEAIAQSPVADRLRNLRLSGGYSATAPPGSCFRAVLSADWPALEALRLDRFEVSDAGLQLLMAAHAGRKRVQVSDDRITTAGARAAVETALPGGPASVVLGKYLTRAEADDVPFVGRELRLMGFHGEGDALAGWVRAAVPPGRFDRLAITGCRMNATGAVVLSAWPGLANLVELDLSNNWIGDLGAVRLAESPHLERVEAVFVASNDITKRGKDALKKRFGRRVRIS